MNGWTDGWMVGLFLVWFVYNIKSKKYFYKFSDLLEIFPPLPSNYEVSPSDLSPYMKKIRDQLKIRNEGEKLIADLGKKEKYIISSYALKAYLRAGVKITGI